MDVTRIRANRIKLITMHRRTFALVATAVFATLALAAHQGVVLRRELKENATEVYNMDTSVHMVVTVPSMGDQDVDMTSSMKYTLTMGKIENGQAAIESKVSDIKTKADGMLAQVMDQQQTSMPKEIVSKGKLDARNHLTLEAAKNSGGMMQLMVGSGSPASSLMFVEFPEKAVNVGDEWSMELPKSPMFGKEAPKVTAKLLGSKDFKGADCWQISVSGTINMDADLTEAMKSAPNNPMSGQKMTMKGKVKLNGEALVDKVTGKTLNYDVVADSTSKMEMPDMGMSIDSSGKIKTTLTLQKS
jgi:hypothetical protein